jgi:hypothetical protein
MLVLTALWLFFRLMDALQRMGSAIANSSRAARARASKTPGFRILMARPVGAASSRNAKWLNGALERHLSVFSFGAPFSLVFCWFSGRVAAKSRLDTPRTEG